MLPPVHANTFPVAPEVRRTRHAERLALFGVTEEDVDVMHDWLFGPDYERHPEKAPDSVRQRAEARVARMPHTVGKPAVARMEAARIIEGVMERRAPPPTFSLSYGDYALRVSIHHQSGPVFELAHPSGAEPLELGHPDGHACAPALRWQEAEALAQRQPPWAMLLLSRAVWRSRDDSAEDFRSFLSRALLASGCFGADRAQALAGRWVPLWQPRATTRST